MPTKSLKIAFTLDVEDGYPPINVEQLNATEIAPGQFELLNSPFFINEIAYGDVVAVDVNENGRLVFKSCLKQSTFKAISIIIMDSKMDVSIMDLLRGQNCVIEYGEFGALRMVAVAIPESADYMAIKKVLDDYEKAGLLSYAELVS